MQINNAAFHRQLPLAILRLVGKALRAGVEVEVTEDGLTDDITVIFRRPTNCASVSLSTAALADLDEIEYLIETVTVKTDRDVAAFG